MKKLMSIGLVVGLLINSFLMVNAQPNISLNNLSKEKVDKMTTIELKEYEKHINQLTDYEFECFLMEYLNRENFSDAQKSLTKLGVKVNKIDSSLLQNSIMVNESTASLSSYDRVDAWEVILDCYSSSRSGSNIQYLTATWDFNDFESAGHDSTYDVIGMYWDKSKADYVDCSVAPGYGSTYPIAGIRDTSESLNGLVVFNGFDTHYAALELLGYTFWVGVRVLPTVDNTWIDYGTTYDHTYTDLSSSYSGDASISFNSNGEVTGSIGFTVSPLPNEATWRIGNSNAWYE